MFQLRHLAPIADTSILCLWCHYNTSKEKPRTIMVSFTTPSTPNAYF